MTLRTVPAVMNLGAIRVLVYSNNIDKLNNRFMFRALVKYKGTSLT